MAKLAQSTFIRHAVGAVRPYIQGPASLPRFLKDVFGAIELERHEFSANSAHVELQINDSVVAVEAGDLPEGTTPWTNTIYVYVADVDAVLSRALALGAELVADIEDKPYDERQAGFRDAAGNTWWISTYKRAGAG